MLPAVFRVGRDVYVGRRRRGNGFRDGGFSILYFQTGRMRHPPRRWILSVDQFVSAHGGNGFRVERFYRLANFFSTGATEPYRLIGISASARRLAPGRRQSGQSCMYSQRREIFSMMEARARAHHADLNSR